MRKDTIIWMGAGQIGLAIVRRIASGKKVIIGDKSLEHARAAADLLNQAGFDAVAMAADLSSRESILSVINEVRKYGAVKYLVNAAGVSPSQASIETILNVDLYGTAVLLEEVGKVIAEGGCGVTISSQSGHRMPALTPEEDRALATTPTDELLSLSLLQPGNVRVTPLAVDEFNGPRGDFYKNMFAKCPSGRPGTADEVAHVAELLMSEKGAFITGSDFLIDGGATASYFYGPLQPESK